MKEVIFMMRQKVYGDTGSRSDFLEKIKNENCFNSLEEYEVMDIIRGLISSYSIHSIEELLIFGTQQLYEDEKVPFATCENYGLSLKAFIRCIGKYYLYVQTLFYEDVYHEVIVYDETPNEAHFVNEFTLEDITDLVDEFGKKDLREFVHHGISKVDSSENSITNCENYGVSISDFLFVVGTCYDTFTTIFLYYWYDKDPLIKEY